MRTPRSVLPARIRPVPQLPDLAVRGSTSTARVAGLLDNDWTRSCPVTSAPATSQSLLAELKAIRRGLGLYQPDLAARLGPGLREACGVADQDPAETVRRKVVTRLRDAAAMLPGDLSVSALAALGLHPEVRDLARLQDRVGWLAARLRRDVRTARRRMDEACGMLAEIAAAGEAGRRTGGWNLVTAQAMLVLDAGAPYAVERRVVVAEHDGIDQLVLRRSVPPDAAGPADVQAQVLFGGLLGTKEWDTATRFRLVLHLPVPLRAGDRHEYCILWRNPPDRRMRPYYVFTPAIRCEHFDLHVRFDLHRPP